MLSGMWICLSVTEVQCFIDAMVGSGTRDTNTVTVTTRSENTQKVRWEERRGYDMSITVIPFTETRELGVWFDLLQNVTVKILLTGKHDVLRDF